MFAIDPGLYLSNTTTHEYGTVNTKETGDLFGANIFGRYYFLELGYKFKTHAEIATGIDRHNSTNISPKNITDMKISGFGIGGSLGANYFLTDKVAINFSFGNIIDFRSSKPANGKASTRFGLNINRFNNFFNTG